MRVHINESRLLEELQDALREAGCVSVSIGPDTLVALHPFALDEKEERIELVFFLRAWQRARPEVELELAS